MGLRELAGWLYEASGLAHERRIALGRRNPWQRLDVAAPLRAFGPGAGDFREYLARESRVHAPTPAAVVDWLQGCRYAEDMHLHDETDHWLHPVTFELVRAGDCEDFSLWAWRKLVEVRVDAAFVVGLRRIPDAPQGRHAWVTFREGSREYVLDGVERGLDRAIRRLDEVRAYYEPQVGVGTDLRPFAYAGLYREAWGRAMRLRKQG
jgi:hypothetical protein